MTDENNKTDGEERGGAQSEYTDAAENVGEALSSPLVLFLAVWKHLLIGMSRRIPYRTRIQKGMIKAGISGLHKVAGGDLIVFTIYGDRAVIPRPGAFNSEEGKIETKNGEEWALTDIELYWVGSTPVAFGVADDHELVSPVAARIAEAVDTSPDRVQPVRETPEGVQAVNYQSGSQAVADGGAANLPFDDVYVDASNPLSGAHGWIVSMTKAYELHWSQSSAEEMKNQEFRGRKAEADPDKHKREMLRLAIIGLGGVALGLFGPALAQRIAGTQVGGGGSIGLEIVPLFTVVGVV